jgi:hypothetical protein
MTLVRDSPSDRMKRETITMTAGSENPEKAFSTERTPVIDRTTGTPRTTISRGRRRVDRRTTTKKVRALTIRICMALLDGGTPVRCFGRGGPVLQNNIFHRSLLVWHYSS